MIFTLLIKCWARCSEFGSPYGKVRLILAVRSRVVACLFHSIEIFQEKNEITLRAFLLKSRVHPQQRSSSWAECCYWNLKFWTFRALFKISILQTPAFIGTRYNIRKKISWGNEYNLLFLLWFIVSSSYCYKTGVIFMVLEDTCIINSLVDLKHFNFALVLNCSEKMFIAMHTPLLWTLLPCTSSSVNVILLIVKHCTVQDIQHNIQNKIWYLFLRQEEICGGIFVPLVLMCGKQTPQSVRL